MTQDATKILIVGAGPYGLSLAAFCERYRIAYRLLGQPMQFWKENMPDKMLLRSTTDWHLDPFNRYTFDAFLQRHEHAPERHRPIALATYLRYCAWFEAESSIRHGPQRLLAVKRHQRGSARFLALLDDGSKIEAQSVVVANGFGACKHVPQQYADLFAPHMLSHTQDLPDPAALGCQSLLVIGGRQSAFEWAALAAEAGVPAVHICLRHATPAFGPADWSWVEPMLAFSESTPGWYRQLPDARKEAIANHMWDIGRGQLEPWLAHRIARPEITLWPNSQVTGAARRGARETLAVLSSGQTLPVDHVLLATGYKTDVTRLDFLSRGELLDDLAVTNAYPDLDERFESSVPGLYFTNRFATKDFGGFFDFTAGCRLSARTIGAAHVEMERT